MRRTGWVTLLAVALLATGMIACRPAPPPDQGDGALEAAERPPAASVDPVTPRPGTRFRKLPAERRVGTGLTPEQEEEIRRLESIGYVTGSTPAVARANVTRYDPARAYAGLNLYTDGYAPEATLIDMEGNVLHQWSYSFDDAFPDKDVPKNSARTRYWRRVALTETGDLLAIYDGLGLIKLDAESNLVWTFPGRAHHDLEIQPDGTIYTLTRKAEMIPRLNKTKPILHDYIVILDPQGQELRRVSLLEAIEFSEYSSLRKRFREAGDILHTNTVEVLRGEDGRDSHIFGSGNVLVSWPTIHTIGVIDMTSEKLVWALSDLWRFQHQPTLLENGRLLLFDNRGDSGKSRVLELDPMDVEIHWSYLGSQTGFFSFTCGSNQRLDNGNTLITETDYGRAFEVTPEGEIVWEFYTPHRAGADGEFIASLFEVVRLPADFPLDWVSGS